VTGSAAGRVLLNGKDHGSGFAIADSLALTAGHVVWSEKMPGGGHRPGAGPSGPPLVYCVDRGEPAAVAVVVQYQPAGAEPIPVTRVEVSTGLDVAVLHLQRPAPAVLPAAGQVATGERWRVDTRPDPGAPVLRGTVTEPHRPLKNVAGQETVLIQLWVEQEIGSYRGYSGSPVLAQSAGGVLGVLVEQAFWRVAAQPGAERPVANVLYAAPIEGVLAEFDLTGVPVARSVRDIPRPVSFEVRRPDQLNQVLDALTGVPSDGQLVGLAGMGGSGKSVLAAAAARDTRVREAFPDGRFWLELGPDPPLLQLQASLAAALGDSRPITDVPSGRARLSSLLAECRCLLVLDNVWDQVHVAAFAVAGPPCRVLVTTRNAATLPGATVIPLGELASDAAIGLLADWAASKAEQLPEEAEQVARECGYLPLAIAVCGALINSGSHGWHQLLGLLSEADLHALPIMLEDYPHPSLAVALAASVGTLPPDARDRYQKLAVFNGQGPVQAAAVEVLWGLDQQHTTVLIRDLADKSLLRTEADRVSLHDLQMDYLVRRAAPNLPALHNELLVAYHERCPGGWASGPDDGYFYQHLAHHLHQADRIQELKALLLDPNWMNTKLATGTIPGLLADYDTLPADPVLRLVAEALRMSARALADDPGQLPSQLTGRLASHQEPLLRELVQRTRQWPATPWLRPLTASLNPPGGPLLRTLPGQWDLRAVAVTVSAHGRRVFSSSSDGTVRVWDLDTGVLLHTLTCHGGEVNALTDHGGTVASVAVSADGRRAVSRRWDGTMRVWDLDTGTLLHTLTGNDGQVRSVAVSADGRRAVSGGADGTVRAWDLDTGTLLHTLTGHDWVTAVAVSADGRCAVSGGWDGTVRVWDLGAGAAVRALTGHDGPVDSVAAGADGRRAVSGGKDGTVRAWDLDTGTLLHILTGHGDEVNTLAVSADGRRAVSGGNGGTVRVWDLDTGTLLHMLAGHDGWVQSVAVSADGRCAVSGGWDGVVRVWDLDTEAPLHIPPGHDGWVQSVAVSADGRCAVSGGNDGTVRVWDLDTEAPLHILTGHDGPVRSVALSADGRRAVSGGSDAMVRVWDLDTGTLHTLTGHYREVDSVAVSADGRRAVSGGNDAMVRVWDLDTGTLHTLTGHYREVDSVAVSADGRRAVSGGKDGTVQVWDLASGRRVATASQRLSRWFLRSYFRFVSKHDLLRRWNHRFLEEGVGAWPLSMSADGRRAVSGDGSRVRVWDLGTGRQLHTLTGHGGQVQATAVSADGRHAISGGDDGVVRVWDLETGALLHTLNGHDGPVMAVAVTADGRRAVSGGWDGVVRVWDLAAGVAIASFASDDHVTQLATTPPGTHVIAGSYTGPVHLLELCAYA
jgi:WD40 repeat protein